MAGGDMSRAPFAYRCFMPEFNRLTLVFTLYNLKKKVCSAARL